MSPNGLFAPKLGGYAFLDQLGLSHAHPKVHRVFHDIGRLTEHDLPKGPVTIKPTRFWGGKGVVVLHPADGGGYIDALSGDQLFLTDAIERLVTVQRERDFKDEWLIEEGLLGTQPALLLPDDIKLYAFRGRIGIILQRRVIAGKERHRWWTPDWYPVETGKYERTIDNTLEPPPHTTEILQLGGRLSSLLPMPYCRIDILATSRGPVVDEFTVAPGRYDGFNDEWDERLGRLWEQAIAESPHDTWPRHVSQKVISKAIDGHYPVSWWRRQYAKLVVPSSY